MPFSTTKSISRSCSRITCKARGSGSARSTPGWWDSAAKKSALAAFNQEANITKRGPLWGNVQKVVYDEVPFIEVGKFNSLSARSAKLEGYTPAIWPFFWNTGLAK